MNEESTDVVEFITEISQIPVESDLHGWYINGYMFEKSDSGTILLCTIIHKNYSRIFYTLPTCNS